MSIDLVNSQATLGTNGTLTLVTEIFMTPAEVAVFGTLTSSVSTVTVDTANSRVHISTALVPTAPVTVAAAETQKAVGDYTNSATAGVVK